MKKRAQNGRATSMPTGLMTGLAASTGITALNAILLAKLLDAETIKWSSIGYGIMAGILLAAFTGAWLSCRKIKRQKAPVCALSGILYWLVLIIMNSLFFKGSYDGIIVTGGLIIAGSGTAFIAEIPKKSKSGQKKYRFAPR